MTPEFERAVGGMADIPQWFVWRLEWDASKQKFGKRPCGQDGSIYPKDSSDPALWRDFDSVVTTVRALDTGSGPLRYALGFRLTKDCGYFLFDIDKCVTNGALSPLADGMRLAFPNAMTEYSSSGGGIHIIGMCDSIEHRSMYKAEDMEFYTDNRGICFGLGGQAWGCADTKFLQPVVDLVERYFKPLPPGLSSNGPAPEYRGPYDDDELIAKFLEARPSAAVAFGSKSSLPQLWRGDCEKDSDNDGRLAAHLAFWTGRDVDRIERLMWRSGLARDKWSETRPHGGNYLRMTILNACTVVNTVYVAPERATAVPGLTKDGEKPRITNAVDLLKQQFEPVQWALKGILPEGVTIISGDPKIGKSWLVYQACIAIATGSPLWPGREPEIQGDALMLALEDNDRRLRRRLDKLLPTFGMIGRAPIPDRLHLATDWRRAEAGVADIAVFLRSHPECRLLVIDTISAFRDPDPGRLSAYASDYATGAMLKPLAKEFKCAIVLVMHNRKQAAGDVMHKVSGTQGMTGSVDNVLVLERGRGEMDAVLHIDGRDIEDQQELALKLDDGKWKLIGNLDDVQRSKERNNVLEALDSLRGVGTAKQIHEAMGGTEKLSAIRMRLTRMVKAGEVENAGGFYTRGGTSPGPLALVTTLPKLPGSR